MYICFLLHMVFIPAGGHGLTSTFVTSPLRCQRVPEPIEGWVASPDGETMTARQFFQLMVKPWWIFVMNIVDI